MKPIVPLLIGAGALLALGAGGSGGAGPQGTTAPPQRVPSVPPGKPPTPEGQERDNDSGRTWGTFYANRDGARHWELPVFSVASSPGNAAIGTGKVIVDVYTTIVANADWQWHGQSCQGHRFELSFSAGRLMKYMGLAPLTCLSVRPLYEVFGMGMTFVQPASTVLLTVDTLSGINHRSPDKMVKSQGSKPGKAAGTGEFSKGFGNFQEDTYPQWDNDNVSSGYVTIDASWIFNKA